MLNSKTMTVRIKFQLITTRYQAGYFGLLKFNKYPLIANIQLWMKTPHMHFYIHWYINTTITANTILLLFPCCLKFTMFVDHQMEFRLNIYWMQDNHFCCILHLIFYQRFPKTFFFPNKLFHMNRLYHLNTLSGNEYLHVSLACIAFLLLFINKYMLVIIFQFNLCSLCLYFNTFSPFCWMIIICSLTKLLQN